MEELRHGYTEEEETNGAAATVRDGRGGELTATGNYG